jgi:putative FmdB family regulatory protein
MPLYDYRCPACTQAFELLVRSSTVPTCPHCGSTALERLLSAPVAPGTSAGIVAAGRRAAARAGHFSHYSRAERAKVK